MRPERRRLWFVVAVTAVLGGFVSGAMLYAATGTWTALPIPAGAVITQEEAATWVAHFTVGPGGGTLVGAWTAYSGAGNIGPAVVNGTTQKPQPPPGIYNCPAEMYWSQTNGTLDRPLAAGAYTMYWNTFCSFVSRIVVTQTIHLVPA